MSRLTRMAAYSLSGDWDGINPSLGCDHRTASCTRSQGIRSAVNSVACSARTGSILASSSQGDINPSVGCRHGTTPEGDHCAKDRVWRMRR